MPRFPLEQWKFKHYGKKAEISVADKYKSEWNKMLGNKVTYLSDRAGIIDMYKTFYDSVNNRNLCYLYDAGFESFPEEFTSCVARISAFPAVCKSYYRLTYVTGTTCKIEYKPIFIMKVLADFIASDKGIIEKLLKLANASTSFLKVMSKVASICTKIYHPHYLETYILISGKLKSSDFA